MSAVTDPDTILRELHNLWQQLGRDQGTPGGVLRACSMTLLVIAGDEQDAEAARRSTGVLMHDHPCRAIVLRVNTSPAAVEPGEEPAPLEARVFAECWKPYGKNQQICAEGVEITADPSQFSGVSRLLVPLIVPDLPVVLWCRGNEAFFNGALEPLFPLAHKVIFDSAGSRDPEGAIARLGRLRARGMHVADLAWARLTSWREVVANVFGEGCAASDTFRNVKIGYSGPPSTTLNYFIRWIERALPLARVARVPPEPGGAGLRSIVFSGGESTIALTRVDGAVEIGGGKHGCRFLLPEVSDDALMRTELAITGADPVFDSVIAP